LVYLAKFWNDITVDRSLLFCFSIFMSFILFFYASDFMFIFEK